MAEAGIGYPQHQIYQYVHRMQLVGIMVLQYAKVFLPSLAWQQPWQQPSQVQQLTTADSIKLYIFYICICEAKRQILCLVIK